MLVDLTESVHVPGKTPPRLLADLQIYDPTGDGRNILCTRPTHINESPPKRHKHSLVLKQDRSTLPSPRDVNTSKAWTAVTICEVCRAHIDIKVDSSEPSLSQAGPCPDGDNPLHHLRYEPSKSQPIKTIDRMERWKDVRVFSCSAPTCPTTVTITTTIPILKPLWVNLLTNKSILEQRRKVYLQTPLEVPSTVATIRPHEALKTLRSYLKNALALDPRLIPRQNRRYSLSLSDDCRDIMQAAHFRDFQDNESYFWAPPPMSQIQDEQSDVYRDLVDMNEEAMILMDQYREKDQDPVRRRVIRADNDIKRILGDDYNSVSNWQIDLTIPEHPCYAGLGIVSDVNDKIILWAYDRQRQCDPDNAPFYFECLEVLANGRKSETLQLEAVKLRSRGEFTNTDVDEAMRALGINPTENNEDLIIGVFNSRLADAPRQEPQMRDHLRIIAKAKNSSRIMQVAQKAFTDAKGAYNWLGVIETTDDQFILSAYEVRVLDNPADETTAKEALKVIAEERASSLLFSRLETDSVYEIPLSIDEAYTNLGIEDQTISDDLIIEVFNLRLSDTPSQFQGLRTALRVIADQRDSVNIKEFLQTGRNEPQPTGSAASPFYFTIKPLRDMVLNFDQYQEDVTEEVVKRKRVGGRKVTKKEIERAKKFVGHLRTLFHDLIKSSASAITPERDLAYLALVSSKDEAEGRENERPIIITDNEEDKMDIDETPPVFQEDDSISETTLVNDSQEDEDHVMTDQGKGSQSDGKENVPPSKDTSATPVGSPRSPLKDVAMNWDTAGGADVENKIPPTPPPNHSPPPIPERPRRNTTTDINMFGRQQDVTECIGNVMFQLEAAIKPDSIDENDEQIDLIKQYFYGKTKQTLAFPNSAETRTKEELFSHLLVNVAEGDRDLYSALDNSFDIEQVDLEGREARRYLSISQLPPVLQIQVQRVQFDREKASAYKSNAHLKFAETIFMDRYISTDDPALMARREKSWKWKEGLRQLNRRKDSLTRTSIDGDVPAALDIMREWVEDIQNSSMIGTEDDMDIDPNLVAILEQRSVAVRREIEAIDKEIKELESRINQQFTDLRKYGYRVHSVFIHRGSVSFGHYWIYIYDFQKRIFRKYNDQYISEVVDQSEVFTHSDTDPQPPTPYFLVFVRDDQLDITEAVRREIVEP